VLPFTREFADTEPAEFIRVLAEACPLREICVATSGASERTGLGISRSWLSLVSSLALMKSASPRCRSMAKWPAAQSSDVPSRREISRRQPVSSGALRHPGHSRPRTATRSQARFPHGEHCRSQRAVPAKWSLRGPDPPRSGTSGTMEGVANIGVRPTLANSAANASSRFTCSTFRGTFTARISR
jgi:hypothetical protein